MSVETAAAAITGATSSAATFARGQAATDSDGGGVGGDDSSRSSGSVREVKATEASIAALIDPPSTTALWQPQDQTRFR